MSGDQREVLRRRIMANLDARGAAAVTTARVAYAAGIASALPLYESAVIMKTLVVLLGGDVSDLEPDE